MNIAVLGPSQSGKTCLAVGLANTSYGKRPFRRAFVAKALEDSSDLLNRFRKQIEGSKWPLGTDETDTLHFVFQRKGESVPIRFNDYKGERSADPDFLKKLDLGKLGSGDGVVLLVNPGFNFDCVREADGTVRFAEDFEVAAGAKPEGHATVSAFDDSPLARQWLADRLHVYEQIVERLETDDEGGNKSDKPVVALAVTASDRLRRKGDLRYLRPRFLAFLEQRLVQLLLRFRNNLLHVAVGADGIDAGLVSEVFQGSVDDVGGIDLFHVQRASVRCIAVFGAVVRVLDDCRGDVVLLGLPVEQDC